MSKPNTIGPMIIVMMVIALIILHQDNWMWDNDTLVGGFMPIQLLYHAGISLAAGITWFTATKIAWPSELESADTTDATDNHEAGATK